LKWSLFTTKDPHGNFGDDLNALLWPEILSPKVLEADDLILVGIGSILDEGLLKPLYSCGKRVVILGTGTGYSAVPRKIDGLYVKAVRGPLTAAAIGLPEAAFTDGAALVAVAPELRPERQETDEILFIPHHGSLSPGRWDLASKAAGMQYGDPRSRYPKSSTRSRERSSL
jgi:succinoglycan biosynthesis protein ExoV